MPNFSAAITPLTFLPHALDEFQQDSITLSTHRQETRILCPFCVFVVRAGRNRQDFADVFHRMNPTLLGDETDHHFRRRPSSAWAKNAAAFRMISLASFNSRFSRSSSLMRALSARRSCSPGISSCSARKIHFRSVSGEQPIFSATLVIADHLVSCSPRVSRKSRTALSRTAGEYLTCELIRTSSQRTCPPANPVRFTSQCHQLKGNNKARPPMDTFRDKFDKAYREYRAIKIFAGMLPRSQRKILDESLETIKASPKEVLVRRATELHQELKALKALYGAIDVSALLQFLGDDLSEYGNPARISVICLGWICQRL